MDPEEQAPGGPGIPPRWTTGAKSGVGTALGASSRVWFTLSHGILNEIYYPNLDQACVRDLGLIVTDGKAFFSEEKRHARSRVRWAEMGVPAFRMANTCREGRYRIEKEVVTDPRRPVVLQRCRFVPLQGALEDYRVHALLAPHLENRGSDDTAWVGEYKGHPMLFARRGATALAFASWPHWLRRSAGFVGVSDGWQDLVRHKQMEWTCPRAENGNVALTGEVDVQASRGSFLLGVGFGRNPAEAGHSVLASLLAGFDEARRGYVEAWKGWHRTLLPLPRRRAGGPDLYRASAAVLRIHEAKGFPGGIIASLSIPWGHARGDDDLGGYHLVWPRDLAMAAGGFLAAGARPDVHRALHYLQVTQETDGGWPQNMWMDGTPYWGGVQLDEAALPILLVDLARREGVLEPGDLKRLWPTVRRAAAFVARNGPATPQDRWEENPGYSTYTLSVEVAGLLAAADLADRNGELSVAAYLRETADAWNASVEHLAYAWGTDLARRVGVEGYYVRVTPPAGEETQSHLQQAIPLRNRPPGQDSAPASSVVSPDALALVRFGLRSPRDPRILNTVKVIDALLKVETPHGPAWRRYNGDGYGEKEGGEPFDGTGVGRAWPLFTGERAHYELAAGRRAEAERLLHSLEGFANDEGLLPEQVWDAGDIPARNLHRGRPTGSATPLVWAHAEYLKLCRSLHDGRVFDLPPQPVQRYQVERRGAPCAPWRFAHPRRSLGAGQTLRIETLAPAVVHWSGDGWRTLRDTPTRDTGLGVHVADLPTRDLPPGSGVDFTFRWPVAGRWEGRDFRVAVK